MNTEQAHSCLISLAANCNQKKNLAEARRRLGQVLSHLTFSKELWTEPFGTKKGTTENADAESFNPTKKRKYLNQLAYAQTTLTVDELISLLKDIETGMGRTPEARQQGIVCIDLDLMKYDETRHHLTDWERPYIQSLLA